MNVDLYVDEIVEKLVARDPKQPEFRQAVEEVATCLCLARVTFVIFIFIDGDALAHNELRK